jgi:hypothetical protein
VPLLVAPLNGFHGCAASDCLWAREVAGEMRIRLVHVPDLLARGRDSCTVNTGDTLVYEEIIKTQGVLARNGTDSRMVRGDTAHIAVMRNRSGLVASYRRVGQLASYIFVSGTCGAGTAMLQTPGADDGAELPYHLDGLLVAVPAGQDLTPGRTWADTIERSDSLTLGRRTSVLVRQFRVDGDTAEGDLPETRVSIETQGTVLTDERIGGKTLTLLVSSSSLGSALFARRSPQMIARSDSTEFRVTVTSGDRDVREQRIESVRILRLMRP